MQYKKKVIQKEYWTTSRTICDRCKKECDKADIYERKEVSIQAVYGEIYPEDDCTTTEKVDCCLDCWNDVVKPGLEAMGFSVRTFDTDDWFKYDKMQEDPLESK